MHPWVKSSDLAEVEATESFVTLDTAQCVLSERSNGNDLALTLDAGNDIGKSIVLSDAIGGQLWEVEWLLIKANLIRETIASNDGSLALTSEHGLDLLKDGGEWHIGRLEEAELPRVGLAPEEGSLGEAFLAKGVLADGDVVIGFNSYLNNLQFRAVQRCRNASTYH